MEKEQAEQLATEIEQQFPHVASSVVQSANQHNYFLALHRKDEPGGQELHIHTRQEWITALEAYHVLRS